MHRSPDLERGRRVKPGSHGPAPPGPEAAPECRGRCDVRLRECTLIGSSAKEDCRKEWRYCVYDCFCR